MYAVIMAGGSGTRFWPWSRKGRAKQFLPIISHKTMLEETLFRLDPEVNSEHVMTIADLRQSEIIREILPSLPARNILVEPQGKNTAPSLILATAHAYLRDSEAVVAALPADHLILDPERFRQKLKAGEEAASQGEYLITFGIPPSFPATGYGYIQFDDTRFNKARNEDFYPVLQFKEKPVLAEAVRFLEDGRYFWNSGMFIWKAAVFAQKLESCAPDMYPHWLNLLDALDRDNSAAVNAAFNEMPSISIDYALMEKADGVLVCRGDFGWSDVGSWAALADIWPHSDSGIAARGEVISLDSQNCLVFSPDKPAALIGVKDLIIADTPDALLVCRTDCDQDVKKIVERLKKDGRKDLL